MNGKNDEETLENQTKLNLSEIYTPEEIKLLKKTIPDISNIIYLVQNNDTNGSDGSKPYKDQINHPQYFYYSSLKKIKNNSNISFFIEKEKFYSLILENIKQYFEKEQNALLIKSVILIMDEILNLSKIIKQNVIYCQFFKSFKNTKLFEMKKSTKSYSKNKEISKKNIKVNSAIYNKDLKNVPNTNEKKNETSNKTNLRSKNTTKNNINVKKQLSFKTEKKIKKNNKPSLEINLTVNTKNKELITKGNKATKNISQDNTLSKGSSLMTYTRNNNKTKINLKKGKNISDIYKKNLTSSNISNPKYNSKKINNNIGSGINKMSLKKNIKDTKNLELYEIINNKCEHCKQKDKENKVLGDGKNDNNNLGKLLNPSNIDTTLYEDIETQEFNIFKLEKEIGRVNILPLIGYYIFKTFNMNEIIKYNKFEKWCQKISDGYVRQNYYHNDLHAADVTHTCLLYFKLGDVEKIHKFSISNKCSLFFSCICHDYQHPGVNNNFLKETHNKLSIRYNDESILENMHISSAFKLIFNDQECYIFEGVENNLCKEMRKEMISCVLATDMAFHNVYVDLLKKYIKEEKEEKKENNVDSKEKTQKCMNILIHSADISNPTKLFDIYFEWAKLVVEEFWDQGDKEKKLNLPCSCDREKVTIYQSQLGFINFIEIPYFSLLAELYPKMQFFYENLLNNKNILLSMQEKEKEKMKNGQ